MSPNTCHPCLLSKHGPEWGYGGSGPADGVYPERSRRTRSVLVALVDEATAEANYQNFKREVIAVLPEQGAVIQRTAVLAWLAGRTRVPSRAA